MLNVNRITTVLARMPDEDLQKYAEMHKADPYIMALAMSESNRRKEVRSADQGSQEEQPKVVDQMIAGMSPRPAQPMPEDMGIGAIPAPNMTMAANGGIVGYDEGGMIAFADGGDVERYQSGGVIAKYQQELQEMGMGTRMQYSPDVQAFVRAQEQASRESYADRERARMLQGPYGGTAQAAPAAPMTAPTYSPADVSGIDRRIMSGSQPSIASLKTLLPTKAAPTADTTKRPLSGAQKTAPPALAATGAATQPEAGGLDALMQNYTRQQDLARGAARNATVGYAGKLREEAAKLVTDEEKRIADKPDVYKDRETRLLKQEKDAEGMGDKYLGLSLLQAGAAMMTTPGGIGMALGKGIQVGSERYVAGIDKINAAKEKFALAKDRLEDLRLSRADMNERDVRDAKKEARSLERQAEALFYSGAKDDLNMTDKQLTTILSTAASAMETDKRIGSAERVAGLDRDAANARATAQLNATLSAPDKVLFKQAMETHGNNAFKAWTAVQQAQGDKFNLRTSYADYLKAFAGKDGLTPPMSIGAYAGLVGATLPR